MSVVLESDDMVALYLRPGTTYKRRKGQRGGPRGRSLLPDGWTGEHEDVVTSLLAARSSGPGAQQGAGDCAE